MNICIIYLYSQQTFWLNVDRRSIARILFLIRRPVDYWESCLVARFIPFAFGGDPGWWHDRSDLLGPLQAADGAKPPAQVRSSQRKGLPLTMIFLGKHQLRSIIQLFHSPRGLYTFIPTPQSIPHSVFVCRIWPGMGLDVLSSVFCTVVLGGEMKGKTSTPCSRSGRERSCARARFSFSFDRSNR